MSADPDRRCRFDELTKVVYEPLQRYLGRRCPADDASEVLNDALLVIWRRLDDVPADEPMPWCYAVARRCLANHRRADDRRLRLVGRVTVHREQLMAPDADASTLGEDVDPVLLRALAELGRVDREIVRLWAWEQLEPREIAAVLELTSNAVSLRLSRAKRRLATSIGRQEALVGGQKKSRHGEEHGS